MILAIQVCRILPALKLKGGIEKIVDEVLKVSVLGASKSPTKKRKP
jgi:hypothetical protein